MLNFKSAPKPAFDYSNLEAHDLANLLPMIDDVNFANLKADIEKNGILDPILIFEGRILDGRNRYRAGMAVGRLTSAAQKQEVICKMLAKYPTESIRQIAKRCGTSHSYVQKIKDKLNEPTPEQKEFTAFCKTCDVTLSEPRRAEFVRTFERDIRDLLGSLYFSPHHTPPNAPLMLLGRSKNRRAFVQKL
jgi:hypothetical protein